MKLDYFSLLSPNPISLSIGNLRKPTLREIDKIGFSLFETYEMFLKLTPEIYEEKFCEEPFEVIGNLEDKSLYSIVLNDRKLQEIYCQIFNFFFEEKVIFRDGLFVFLNPSKEDLNILEEKDVCGIIQECTFPQILNIMQQTCCICDKQEEDINKIKFKNKKAKELYIKMLKGQKEREKAERAKNGKNYTLANIISSVSNQHKSINPINVWDLTVFQLYDAFDRLQLSETYDITKRQVSVWGDEKKSFDNALWFKNIFDK